MTRLNWAIGICVFTLVGCVPKVVSRSALERARVPAFVSRTLNRAGPTADVFRADSSWSRQVTSLEPSEAERQLTVQLNRGMSKFETAETLRAKVIQLLPSSEPWSSALPSADVSRALQSLLVSNADDEEPDFASLRRAGADVVVEFVVERYGLRSQSGKTTTFLLGYGRMFRLDNNEMLWRRSYEVELAGEGNEKLNPVSVLTQPELFRTEMNRLLDAVAEQFARDLDP